MTADIGNRDFEDEDFCDPGDDSSAEEIMHTGVGL
jgi:hypothetical protein